MYPQVIQFETRDLLLAEQLELLRARRVAATRVGAEPSRRRLRLRPSLLPHRVPLEQ